MGNLIWHDFARYVSLTATVCEYDPFCMPCTPINSVDTADTIWASFWGILYRKFFWDFVGGVLRAPGGLQCVFTINGRLSLC